MTYTTRAFILKREPHRQDDARCLFLTERGTVTVVAQGIRRQTAKQRSGLKWFTPLTLRIGTQRSAEQGGRLLTIESETHPAFTLEQRMVGFAFIDIIRAFGGETHEHSDLFRIAYDAFRALPTHSSSRLLSETIGTILAWAGYLPETVSHEHRNLHDHARLVSECNLFCPLPLCQK